MLPSGPSPAPLPKHFSGYGHRSPSPPRVQGRNGQGRCRAAPSDAFPLNDFPNLPPFREGTKDAIAASFVSSGTSRRGRPGDVRHEAGPQCRDGRFVRIRIPLGPLPIATLQYPP